MGDELVEIKADLTEVDLTEVVPTIMYLPTRKLYLVSCTYPPEALNKNSIYNMGNKIHVLISRHDIFLSSYYRVSMQCTLSQFSVNIEDWSTTSGGLLASRLKASARIVFYTAWYFDEIQVMAKFKFFLYFFPFFLLILFVRS